MKNQNGFTLVELMVVVAIIGLLSSVAVLNFKKYQAKSKIVEAKLQLSALYTAEASFFSEYNIYAKCLPYIGYDPSAEIANRYYAIGFCNSISVMNVNAKNAAINSGLNSTECPNDSSLVPAPGTNANIWFAAGKGVGNNKIDLFSECYNNAAGASISCLDSTMGGAAGFGSCLGSMAASENMAYQATAVGVISGDYTTQDKASGLSINHNKILKSVVNGY